MKRQTLRNRFFVSQWYMGAGDLMSIFSLRPNQPFEKVKSIYGEKIINALSYNKQSKLTQEQREKIKNDFRREYKKTVIKQLLLFVLSVIISIAVFFILFYSIRNSILKSGF